MWGSRGLSDNQVDNFQTFQWSLWVSTDILLGCSVRTAMKWWLLLISSERLDLTCMLFISALFLFVSFYCNWGFVWILWWSGDIFTTRIACLNMNSGNRLFFRQIFKNDNHLYVSLDFIPCYLALHFKYQWSWRCTVIQHVAIYYFLLI